MVQLGGLQGRQHVMTQVGSAREATCHDTAEDLQGRQHVMAQLRVCKGGNM